MMEQGYDSPLARWEREIAALRARIERTTSLRKRCAYIAELERVLDEMPLDTTSSASRQHYIDTGRYLAMGEADE